MRQATVTRGISSLTLTSHSRQCFNIHLTNLVTTTFINLVQTKTSEVVRHNMQSHSSLEFKTVFILFRFLEPAI